MKAVYFDMWSSLRIYFDLKFVLALSLLVAVGLCSPTRSLCMAVTVL